MARTRVRLDQELGVANDSTQLLGLVGAYLSSVRSNSGHFAPFTSNLEIAQDPETLVVRVFGWLEGQVADPE